MKDKLRKIPFLAILGILFLGITPFMGFAFYLTLIAGLGLIAIELVTRKILSSFNGRFGVQVILVGVLFCSMYWAIRSKEITVIYELPNNFQGTFLVVYGLEEGEVVEDERDTLWIEIPPNGVRMVRNTLSEYDQVGSHVKASDAMDATRLNFDFDMCDGIGYELYNVHAKGSNLLRSDSVMYSRPKLFLDSIIAHSIRPECIGF